MQEKEVEARRASLGKWKLELLHKLMDLLDLPRGSGEKVMGPLFECSVQRGLEGRGNVGYQRG